MIWQNDVSVTIDEIVYHLSVSAGNYADDWIFKVEDITHTCGDNKLLPHTVYLRFDRDKKYISCLPVKSIPPAVSDIIVAEIKKHQDTWKRGIGF